MSVGSLHSTDSVYKQILFFFLSLSLSLTLYSSLCFCYGYYIYIPTAWENLLSLFEIPNEKWFDKLLIIIFKYCFARCVGGIINMQPDFIIYNYFLRIRCLCTSFSHTCILSSDAQIFQYVNYARTFIILYPTTMTIRVRIIAHLLSERERESGGKEMGGRGGKGERER